MEKIPIIDPGDFDLKIIDLKIIDPRIGDLP